MVQPAAPQHNEQRPAQNRRFCLCRHAARPRGSESRPIPGPSRL